MAYYIFLKSLRSLEEFRKNLHVKIPPKSPCANFQSLGKFKNSIFNSEIIFFAFGPADLAAHSAIGPTGPTGLSPLLQAEAHRPAQPARPMRTIGVMAEVCFLLRFTPSVLGAFSLSTAYTWALRVSPIFPITPVDPGRKSSVPPLPASPAPRLGCRQVFTTPPSSFPPLIPFKPSLNKP
jgi:hypothetical protein